MIIAIPDARLLAPIGTLVLGWLLSEVGHRARWRRSYRDAVGRAIADLLEIRHFLRSLELTLGKLRSVTELPPDALPQLMAYLPNLYGDSAAISTRFNTAVDALAAADPLLAFNLRSKDRLPIVLQFLGAGATTEPTIAPMVEQVQKLVWPSMIKGLDDSIARAAWHHGPITWLRVRRRLRRGDAHVPERDQLIAMIERSMPQSPLVARPAC